MTVPTGHRTVIGTLEVDPITLDAMLTRLEDVVLRGRRIAVTNVNAHAVCLAEQDSAFRAAINDSEIVFCDGKSVQWASRFLGQPLPERFSPPDWIDRLCKLATANSYRLFFLGGAKEVVRAAADRLAARHPDLSIGTHHGYFDKNGPDNHRIVEMVNQWRPQFLFVGFGMPLQELWIADNLEDLDVNVALSVGGMFDFVSGYKARGPRWMTDHGFEWLTRLAREPRRLGGRYLLGNARFLAIVARTRLLGVQ